MITGHGKLAVFLERHVPWLIAAGVRGFGIKARSEARRRHSEGGYRTR